MNYLKTLSISFLLTFSTFGSLAFPSSLSSTAITIEQAVHFITPEGEDLVVEPGNYEVAAREQVLMLTPEGKETPLHIQAQEPPVTEEDLSFPVAMAIPVEEEGIYLALEVPNQPGLEAMGSYSGIQTRGRSFLNIRKAFKPKYRKHVKSFASKLRKNPKAPSLKKEWAQLHKKRTTKGKSTKTQRGPFSKSTNTNALMVQVLRQTYLESQKDMQQHRAKIRETNKKKQQTRQKLNETRRKAAKTRSHKDKNLLKQIEERLKREMNRFEETNKNLNFQLQQAAQKYNQAHQTMSRMAKQVSDTQKNVIENLR